ncbi:hypothetical protein LPJ64_003660 [Coemansia asiatica]|uniref:C3H1-type domain-containing protein n=1 Tax=Coemansia asiatica TaxID=1052880 RepID=A0A9W8CJC2_9FUNG|nr:hypothetical protein LPJ64_003660 [Coemansia asiatica]
MSDNEELKRQIALLQSAIISQRPSVGKSARYSSSLFRPHSQRFSPVRPVVRPSRNMKLIVKDESQANGKKQQENAFTTEIRGSDSDNMVKYVSSGNKLVRVGSGLSTVSSSHMASVRRPSPGFGLVRPRNSSMTLRNAGQDHSSSSRVVNIDGEAYVRKGRGNKLVRASAAPEKPASNNNNARAGGSIENKRIISIDGEDFIRSKSGSLIRISALRKYNRYRDSNDYRRAAVAAFKASKRQKKRLCTKFLYDKCESTADECAFSHELGPETVPLCLHYQRDMCTKPSCRFVHIKDNPEAPTCRDFVYKGFCPKGSGCKHRHIWQCPDWVEKGKCMHKKCKLPHPFPSKKSASGAQTSVETALGARQMSNEDEEHFVKSYIQRPMFDKNRESDEVDDLLLLENELARGEDDEEEEEEEEEDEGHEDLEDDLSGDEAEELLKWYDDNFSKDNKDVDSAVNTM